MIPFLDLQAVTAAHGEEIREAVAAVVDSGWYLLGERVKEFERQYADYIGVRHAIATANGLDALTLMLRAYIELGVLEEGDEIIVPANTYIATILSITENRLRPVLVEPRADTLNIDADRVEEAINDRTRAIMIVHLYGRNAYTPQIGDICHRRGLLLLEDNAQAHGCRTAEGHRTGSVGHASAHSFYPGKNLGALGDAGCVTTNDDRVASLVRALANYGSSRKYVFPHQGRNSRMDELQAAVLSVKLQYLDADNQRRQQIAAIYQSQLQVFIEERKNSDCCRKENAAIVAACCRLPQILPIDQNVYHLFPIFCADKQQRDALQQHLSDAGIQTLIHYPIPPHRQECYRSMLGHLSLPITEHLADTELSLPISPVLTDGQVRQVCQAICQMQR